MSRKQISAGVRFAVLRRDNFTCQYCGAKAPDVELHVDHIHPLCHGGTNDMVNLITACKDCNLGKSGDKFDALCNSPLGISLLERYGYNGSPAVYFMSVPAKKVLRDYGYLQKED